MSRPRQPHRRPNIILITTDQQRYDTLGVTGNPHIRTPHLDRLAARGTLFDRAYIQNPVCVPSRACIMTGRYVHQHGVEYMENEVEQTPGLPPWETTVMERLQATGYATAAFGKIHMLPPKGFDEMQLTLGKGARWTEAEGSPLGPAQLGPVYAEWLDRKRSGAYESIYAQRRRPEYRDQATAIINTLAADEYVDYWVAENTISYLERPDVGAADQPFFVWCGFCGPHTPFDPPEPYANLYDPADVPLSPLLHARRRNVAAGDQPSRFDRADGERLARKITAYYWGMVTAIDDMVGKIMDALTQRGLWENTLILFTSDHGEMLGDYGQLGKGNFTEAVINVPCIVVPPGGSPPADGRPCRADNLVELIDLAPTILDYADIPQPDALPGTSLRPYLQSPVIPTAPRHSDDRRNLPRGASDERDSSPRLGMTAGAARNDGEVPEKEAVLCEYVSNDRRSRRACLRTDRYKYIASGSDRPVEFYDLLEGPRELVNVAADPAYQAEVHRHAELLLHRLMTTTAFPWNSDQASRDRERLDSFGRPITQHGRD